MIIYLLDIFSWILSGLILAGLILAMIRSWYCDFNLVEEVMPLLIFKEKLHLLSLHLPFLKHF